MATIAEILRELVKEAEIPEQDFLAFRWVDEVLQDMDDELVKVAEREEVNDLIELSAMLSKLGLAKLAEEYEIDLNDPNLENDIKYYVLTGELTWYGIKSFLEEESKRRDLSKREKALYKIAEDLLYYRPLGTSLVSLYTRGIIDEEDLFKYANNPDEFVDLLTKDNDVSLFGEDLDEDFEIDDDDDYDEYDLEDYDEDLDEYDEDYDEDLDEYDEDYDEDFDEDFDDYDEDYDEDLDDYDEDYDEDFEEDYDEDFEEYDFDDEDILDDEDEFEDEDEL